ncbi:MAG: FkbM family methyltransferase [Alphaproteobacteria bacterium]
MLFPQSIVDRDMLIWGDWEAEQKAMLMDAARRYGADIFLDIGACFGLYALTMKKAFPDCEVHAFEPHPVNRRQLEANCLINPGIGEITVHGHALGERHETLGIKFDTHRNRGAARLNEDIHSEFMVDVLPLDNLLPYRGRTIIMKIDVEGSESRVLRGMRQVLANNRCFLQVECLSDQDQVAFRALLDELDLRVVTRIGEDTFVTNMAPPP